MPSDASSKLEALDAGRAAWRGKENEVGAGSLMFRRFGPDDIGLMRRLTAPFPPYADMNAVALLTWDTTGDGEMAIVNGNVAFRLRQYDGEGTFLSFIGTHQVVKTARQLLAYARSLPDAYSALLRIPETTVRHAAGLRERFMVTADPDEYDYVFGVADMAAMTGPGYTEMRGEIRRLQRETAPELRQLDVREPYAQALMRDLFDRWAAAKGVTDAPETRNERTALERLLLLSKVLGDRMVVMALFDAVGEPIGFCCAEVLNHGYAIGHFEKTDPAYPGVSPLLRQRMAQYLLQRGCRYLNGEADLGEPGLRESKRSWRPRFYLRKYRIAER
jgi:hypothetical protein